jgi:hypothetical protein
VGFRNVYVGGGVYPPVPVHSLPIQGLSDQPPISEANRSRDPNPGRKYKKDDKIINQSQVWS